MDQQGQESNEEKNGGFLLLSQNYVSVQLLLASF